MRGFAGNMCRDTVIATVRPCGRRRPHPAAADLVRRRDRRADRAVRRHAGQLGGEDGQPAGRRRGPGPGDRAAVLLPPHWQTAAVLLGCWAAGLAVDLDDLRTRRRAVRHRRPGRRRQAHRRPASATPSAWPRWPPPLREVPAGFADYVVEVRGHGDHFTPYAEDRPGQTRRWPGAIAADPRGAVPARDQRGRRLGLARRRPGADRRRRPSGSARLAARAARRGRHDRPVRTARPSRLRAPGRRREASP